MATINTNVPAIIAQSHLRRSQQDLQVSLERLASGLRINRGADDPAGLIVSENLRAEIAGVRQAIDNSQRASNIIATSEGALNEVAALLIDVQDLIVEAANKGALSPEEIRANQLQVDSAIESITRIANVTTFAGRKLLNGSLDYITSGLATSALAGLQIQGAQFGSQPFIPVSVSVTQSAQKAELSFQNSQVSTAVTIELAGTEGVITLSFVSGTTASAMANAINTQSDSVGAQAIMISSANPASGFTLRSTGYGTDAFVSVKPLPGSTFDVVNAAGSTVERDRGQDAVATINGAQTAGEGLKLVLNSTTLDMTVTLAETFGLGSTTFAITEGGALFQLGPQVETNQQVNFGLQSVAASRLGNGAVGFLSQIATGQAFSLVDGQTPQAAKIVDEAIRQISTTRGRLGAFEKNTLQTNVRQLEITFENLTSAESAIRDADFALESSRLMRNQILVSAGTSVLALANATPQSVLALLGG